MFIIISSEVCKLPDLSPSHKHILTKPFEKFEFECFAYLAKSEIPILYGGTVLNFDQRFFKIDQNHTTSSLSHKIKFVVFVSYGFNNNY